MNGYALIILPESKPMHDAALNIDKVKQISAFVLNKFVHRLGLNVVMTTMTMKIMIMM